MLDWIPIWVWVLVLVALAPIEVRRIRRARHDPEYAAERAQRTYAYSGFRMGWLAVVMTGFGLWSLLTTNWQAALVCFLFVLVGVLFVLVLKRRAQEARARAFRQSHQPH
jgi:hypothetical protein